MVMLSVEPKASCANGRRRLRIRSKELTCPHHLRSFLCFLVRNAFTPLRKRLCSGPQASNSGKDI